VHFVVPISQSPNSGQACLLLQSFSLAQLAILPLTSPLSILPYPSSKNSKTAHFVLESRSGHPFFLFQQIEDPSMLYIVGKWDSVAAHHDFLPSASNQKLLDTLKEDIAMSGTDERQMEMWHLDNDVFSLGNSQGDRSVFTAPARSCNRHFVPVEKKAGSGGNLGNSGGSWRSIQSPTRLWVNGGLRKRMWVEI
jgi:hypothetical protein